MPLKQQQQQSRSSKNKSKKEQQQLAKLRKARLKNAPTFVMMVGLPGSGKSTFAQRLVSSSNDGAWVRVCQDELGSRPATEDLCSRIMSGKNAAPSKKNFNGQKQRCVLDGCNVTPQVRKRWLNVAMAPPSSCVAVYFSTSAGECKRRVAARVGHPSGDLFRWGGDTIIDTKAKNLAPPTTEEGFGKVHEVRTLEEANALLFSLGGSPFDETEAGAWGAGGDDTSNSEGNKDSGGSFRMCKESAAFDANTLVARLGLSDSDVDNIYAYGSRLWGTANNETSDFDFVVVRKSDAQKKAVHVGGSRIDATIMGRSEFQDRLACGEFLVTVCMYLPPQAVWRERWDPRREAAGSSSSACWKLDPAVLCAGVLERAGKNLILAEKHFSKGGHAKAQKILSHSVRMLILTAQIVGVDGGADKAPAPKTDGSSSGNGSALDIKRANKHYDAIVSPGTGVGSWNACRQPADEPMRAYRALLESRAVSEVASAGGPCASKKNQSKKNKKAPR